MTNKPLPLPQAPARLLELVPWIFERLGDVELGACWIWPGPLYVRKTRCSIRKAVWRLYRGGIARGGKRQIKPVCGNARCVNPAHLQPTSSRGRRIQGDLAWQARRARGTAFEGDTHPSVKVPDALVREAVRLHVLEGWRYDRVAAWLKEQGHEVAKGVIAAWSGKRSRRSATEGLPKPPGVPAKRSAAAAAKRQRIRFLAAQALTNREIAKLCGVSYPTIEIALRGTDAL